jgi:benzoyl-CoA reductase/2-hydroxyglutaryl-CoA dehydratase subunit BcrC/BadD/HgdB
MVQRCLDYAMEAKSQGRPIVGILCEYTPREVIMAAGGVPVCLCGGSAEMASVAEEQLPANLCPLIKSTYGYALTRKNPFLEMADLIVAETTCDGKKKMYELLGERYPMYVLELPQKPDDGDAAHHWYRELCKLAAFLGKRYGLDVSTEALRAATALMNRERGLRRRLASLMIADAPPFAGREILDLKSLIACIPEDLDYYEGLVARYGKASAPGLRERPVRVLLTGVPIPHGAEKVMELIENNGGLVVCQENCTGLKPIMNDVPEDNPDMLAAIATHYFHLPCSVMTTNTRRMELLASLAAQYKADCVIELVWQTCLTYDIESYLTRQLCEQSLDLPYLRIETDYSPSDNARITTRIQALFETVEGRKTCSSRQG